MKVHTSLYVCKQNFKFSAAHFLIFDSSRAEQLHGHNYRVLVEMGFSDDRELAKKGFQVDFSEVKSLIKTRLDQWDEVILLPGEHPELTITEVKITDVKTQVGPHLLVQFRDRRYQFPKKEVVVLPILNTSVELLSRLLCQELLGSLKKYGVNRLSVRVEETQGQGAKTSLQLTK